ncbi:sigma factor [Streptomyces endophyticus]|uniref:RNA polymerase subunit sigma-70 n=1 Tax=Streptomyces endophyticus TaxID=714166 RepID=A0ABU6F6S7_9ACTN|nr:sigma factor [Streptomyces endophyticus]MEB8339362.1 RNA polymerase subunit sigma-70 [Streptomyces endophyticus]
MTDGPAAAPIPPAATEGGLSPAAYARIYEAEQTRLVAYARSLTGSPWLADDLVAEAHFRVWRRLAAGHDIDNVAAYLTTTVRHLAASAGRGAARETPLDPHSGVESVQVSNGSYASGAYGDQDPAARASAVDLLSQVLGQLPKRWVKALWLAEAEGQPLEAVGRGIGAGSGATAVLLHRAREGMRQAFLRAHPGTPDDPACESHWDRMPAHVRGSASARQSEKLLAHIDDCDDCRARLAVLLRANDRLPALVGPALLIFVLGGAGKFLVPLAAGAGAGATGAAAGGHGAGSGLLHGVRHALTGGAKAQGAVAGVLGVSVAGAAVAAGLMLAGNNDSVPPQRSAAVQHETPTGRDSAPSAPSSHPSTTASRKPVAPQDRPQRTTEPDAEAAPGGSADTEAPATPTTPPDPPAAERSVPDEPTADEPPSDDTPTEEPATRAAPPAQTPTPTPTPTPTAEPTTPTEPTPTPTPTPTEPAEPTTPPEPSTPTPTCTHWLGPIYICRAG